VNELTEEITTKRLLLRPLRNSDLQDVYKQWSDPDMCEFYNEPPCSIEEAEGFVKHYQFRTGNLHARYCITDRSTNVFIGTCGFHFWDKANKRVEIGYDIWKEFWRQGYAKEALKPLLNICFEELGVECVYALTHIDNIASEELLLSIGFSLDGILRGWVNVGGKQQSQKCFTILREDWGHTNRTPNLIRIS
jgi:ribosomal-protein-alanine N-acetyltransferase